mmetsp:Transcript_47334/g.119225  ORF Transcript_47334/g.119225 Transcript_47334/m.119225 type:complete len:202 (-) Transcript_47334:145-750(-)
MQTHARLSATFDLLTDREHVFQSLSDRLFAVLQYTSMSTEERIKLILKYSFERFDGLIRILVETHQLWRTCDKYIRAEQPAALLLKKTRVVRGMTRCLDESETSTNLWDFGHLFECVVRRERLCFAPDDASVPLLWVAVTQVGLRRGRSRYLYTVALEQCPVASMIFVMMRAEQTLDPMLTSIVCNAGRLVRRARIDESPA